MIEHQQSGREKRRLEDELRLTPASQPLYAEAVASVGADEGVIDISGLETFTFSQCQMRFASLAASVGDAVAGDRDPVPLRQHRKACPQRSVGSSEPNCTLATSESRPPATSIVEGCLFIIA